MEQRTLSLKIGNKEIVSKPWDFEAMCIVDDARKDSKGDLAMAKDAVTYLFEGTEATEEMLNAAQPVTLATFCRKVCNWYIDDMSIAIKNAQSPRGKAGKKN